MAYYSSGVLGAIRGRLADGFYRRSSSTGTIYVPRARRDRRSDAQLLNRRQFTLLAHVGSALYLPYLKRYWKVNEASYTAYDKFMAHNLALPWDGVRLPLFSILGNIPQTEDIGFMGTWPEREWYAVWNYDYLRAKYGDPLDLCLVIQNLDSGHVWIMNHTRNEPSGRYFMGYYDNRRRMRFVHSFAVIAQPDSARPECVGGRYYYGENYYVAEVAA